MEQHPTSLVPFLKELQKLLARTMPENIKISLSYEDEDAIANADPSRLQQVFMNLALNARDAMSQGGELRFELNLLELGEGQAPPSPGMSLGRWICIQVSDTGCGIAPEALPHIFEPFFTTKEIGSGTGLGLAQVYGIVQQHNGHILVRSELGRGTKFSIFLPALFAPTTLLSPGRTEPVERGHQQSILVVEDDAATREGVREVLESLNYRVQVATDGKEALSIYGSHGGFDLVITDLVMPGLGGMALYKTLRETDPGVRVIIMTGYPLGHGTRELLEEGQIFWIQKPLNTVMLAGAIRQVLQSDPEDETGITTI
jgi:CheY-like chemotaxis protein